MRVVGYVRLSRDEDKENYSSIETQQNIINEFAKKHGWSISKIYIDDNYTGYTFDRPAFQEMKSEIENGNIDIIIAKDLSRLGRHNAWTQIFIEDVQKLGKRILLPEEGKGYDSNIEDDILGIKTWYNEMYVKDISRKIRASMLSKQKKGELIMGNYYGYKKVRVNDKFVLIPDDEIKPIIQLIFKLYIEGLGYKKICDILNEKGYITPSEYIKKRHEQDGRVFKNLVTDRWQTHMIQRIIANDVYRGVLRTRKMHSSSIKGEQKSVPPEEQFVFENHHDAIISIEDFELAQNINTKRKKVNYRGKAEHKYIFSGFIVCNDCGFSAIGKNLKRRPKVELGYECTTYQKYGLKQCKSHAVPEKKILFFFKEFLKEVRDEYQGYINTINIADKKKKIHGNLNKLNKELNILNEELKVLINQKIKDLMKEDNLQYKEIIENSYIELENDKKKRINELVNKIDELKKLDSNNIEKNIKTTIDIFNTIIDSEVPDRKLLEMILDKIKIDENRNLEFKLLVNIDKLTYSQL